jgi:mRNA interferase MazF
MSPLTTCVRGIPTEVALGPENGLPGHSVVNLDVIITASKRSLHQRIDALSSEKLSAVEDAIHFAFGLDA